MEISKSQKVLKVLGILEVIAGIFAIVGGILVMGVGGYGAVTLDPTEEVVQGAGALIGTGIVTIVSGIVSLVIGILCIRAGKDASKVKPLWILAIVGVVFSVISLITSISGGTDSVISAIASLLVDCVIFYIVNNVKKQAA